YSIVEPTLHVENAAGVEKTIVPASPPAVLETLRRQFGLAEIARRERGPAYCDLTRLAIGQRPELGRVRIDDADVGTGHRLSCTGRHPVARENVFAGRDAAPASALGGQMDAA